VGSHRKRSGGAPDGARTFPQSGVAVRADNPPKAHVVSGRDGIVCHYGALKAIARRLVRSDRVRDVVQETMCRAFQARTPIDQRRVLPWLAAILRRVIADLYRQRPTSGLEELERIGSRLLADQREPPPDLASQRAEAARDLRSLLDRLSPTGRQALLLRLDGFSVAEIARRLTKTPKATERLLARTVAQLRRLITAAAAMSASRNRGSQPQVQAGAPSAGISWISRGKTRARPTGGASRGSNDRTTDPCIASHVHPDPHPDAPRSASGPADRPAPEGPRALPAPSGRGGGTLRDCRDRGRARDGSRARRGSGAKGATAGRA
jgi:RNA polymerase sigma factor (sigma-70 family)